MRTEQEQEQEQEREQEQEQEQEQATEIDVEDIAQHIEDLRDKSPITRVDSARSLARLASSSTLNQDAIREAGGISRLVELVSDPEESPPRQAAVRALAHLSSDNPANQDAIRRMKGIAPLVGLLRGAPLDTCRYAVRAIVNLAVDNESNQEEIAEAGAIASLITLLVDTSSLRENAVRALAILITDHPANASAAAAAGGIAALIQLRTDSNAVVREHVELALAVLMADQPEEKDVELGQPLSNENNPPELNAWYQSSFILPAMMFGFATFMVVVLIAHNTQKSSVEDEIGLKETIIATAVLCVLVMTSIGRISKKAAAMLLLALGGGYSLVLLDDQPSISDPLPETGYCLDGSVCPDQESRIETDENCHTYDAGKADSPDEVNNIAVEEGVGSLHVNQYQKKLSAYLETHRIVCIHGAGGAGKSTLAQAEAIREDFPYLFRFQIAAYSDDALLAGLARLYRRLYGQGEFDELKKQENMELREETLLIGLHAKLNKVGWSPAILLFDNHQGDVSLLGRVIDVLLNVRILITTRSGGVFKKRKDTKRLSLNAGWSSEDRLQFLEEDLGDLKERQVLADYLPFPLGLKVAAQTIENERETNEHYGVSDYLREIKAGSSDQKEIGSFKYKLKEVNRRQTFVLKRAIRVIKSKEGKILLQLLGYLSPLPIPQDLLKSYFNRLFPRDSGSNVSFSIGLNEVRLMSLVDTITLPGTEKKSLRMHELVQDVARREFPMQNTGWWQWLIGEPDHAEMLSEVLINSLSFEYHKTEEGRELKKVYQSHLAAFLEHQTSRKFYIAEAYWKLEESINWPRGIVRSGIKIEEYENAMNIMEEHYGADSINLLERLIPLTNLYIHNDSYRSITLFDRSLKIMEAHNGEVHDDLLKNMVTLNAKMIVGCRNMDYKRSRGLVTHHHEESIKPAIEFVLNMSMRVFKIAEQYYGTYDFNLLESMLHLASLYGEKKILELLESAFNIAEKNSLLSHDLYLRPRSKMLAHLAVVYNSSGQIEKQAETLERRMNLLLSANFYTMHGKFHELRALLKIFRKSGQVEKRIEWLRTGIDYIDRRYGPKYGRYSSMILRELHDLQRLYGSLGEVEKQIKVLEHSYSIEAMQVTFANSLYNPITQIMQKLWMIVDSYGALGQIDNQKLLLERAAFNITMNGKPGYPRIPLVVAEKLEKLADFYVTLGQLRKIQQLLERALMAAMIEVDHVPDNLHLMWILNNLGHSCMNMWNKEKEMQLQDLAFNVTTLCHRINSVLTIRNHVQSILPDMQKENDRQMLICLRKGYEGWRFFDHSMTPFMVIRGGHGEPLANGKIENIDMSTLLKLTPCPEIR